MPVGLIGTKVGMTRVFGEDGNTIPVTVIKAGPCRVLQVKTVESAGYAAVQIGFGWDDLWLSATSWTLLKLAFAGAVAATVIMRRGDMVFVLVVAWAAYGISVKQAATPSVAGAAWMLALLALMLVSFELLRRLRYSRE